MRAREGRRDPLPFVPSDPASGYCSTSRLVASESGCNTILIGAGFPVSDRRDNVVVSEELYQTAQLSCGSYVSILPCFSQYGFWIKMYLMTWTSVDEV
jgi:hypothetical protein